MKLGGSSLLSAICLACRCLHARCGADGVYGQGRRIPAARWHRGSPARRRSASRSAARRVISRSSSHTTRRAAQHNLISSPFGIHGIVDEVNPLDWNPRSVLARIRLLRAGPADLLGPLLPDLVGAVGLSIDLPQAGDVDHAAVPLRGHRAGQRPEYDPVTGRLLLDQAVDRYHVYMTIARRELLVAHGIPCRDRVLHSGGLPGGRKHHRQITPRTFINLGGQTVMDSYDRAARRAGTSVTFHAASSLLGRPACRPAQWSAASCQPSRTPPKPAMACMASSSGACT